MAEFKNPRLHKPPAALTIMLILRVCAAFADLYIHHPIVADRSKPLRSALHTAHEDDHERHDEKESQDAGDVHELLR